MSRIWGNPGNPNFHSTLSSIHRKMICDGALDSFDGAGATEELFLSGPSPRSRRSCIKKPHRKSSSKPPLRHAELLALVTCLHCQSCLIITKSKGMTVLGVGASQVAGLLGEGPHPAGGRAGMMGRERLPRDEEGYESREERAQTPTPCPAKNCQLP